MKPINVNDPTPKSKSNFQNMTPSVTSSSQKHGNYVGKNIAAGQDKNMMQLQGMQTGQGGNPQDLISAQSTVQKSKGNMLYQNQISQQNSQVKSHQQLAHSQERAPNQNNLV